MQEKRQETLEKQSEQQAKKQLEQQSEKPEGRNRILVIGHRNPDTDSICSALAYAQLKNKIDPEHEYVACRAGQINEETSYVLDFFGVKAPQLIEDVRPQIRDIEIRRTPGVTRSISLKKAWSIMRELNVVTLPVTVKNRLDGLITEGDITKSFMEGYDSKILSMAHTRYSNIVETLGGVMIVGDEKAYFTKGKVLVAAANPDLMESYIEKNDLVILGNRYESQLCAIEMGAACIIVCEGAPVSRTIKKMAEDRECTVISTPFDTFTTARFINQSMPISYFMKRNGLISFEENDYIDDIRDTMARVRHRDFPILRDSSTYVGFISRRNLLGARKKKVILVDHNEQTQAVKGVEDAEILEIIDHHRLAAIETMSPVYFRNQPLGCTATIIAQMYQEQGQRVSPEIAGLLCSAILSDTLLFRSPTCTRLDQQTAQELAQTAGIIPEAFAKEMFAAGSNLKGKTTEQIFYQDFKRYSVEGLEIGVGQISTMNREELVQMKETFKEYLQKEILSKGMDMGFFMMTSILEESTLLLGAGEQVKRVAEAAFSTEFEQQEAVLPGVVSRKKQLIPALMRALQELNQSL